ncbi:RNA polymerase sigma-70 domain protein [Rhodopirellula sp. SWK7]|nr:RNA polymerase sigma-70 domain protein [Rhodopirellula sp. SWK7]
MVSDRIDRLTRKMIRGQSAITRWDQTDDIAQLARMRLWRALDEVDVTDPAGLMTLAARHIRWLLIDRVRKNMGPQGIGANHATAVLLVGEDGKPTVDAVDSDPSDVRFRDLHEAVEELPDELRSVIDLVYYNGLSRVEAANILQTSEKTVQRRCKHAQKLLAESLGESNEVPG